MEKTIIKQCDVFHTAVGYVRPNVTLPAHMERGFLQWYRSLPLRLNAIRLELAKYNS